MQLQKAAVKIADPRRAVSYARHPAGGLSTRGIPFVVWLVLLLGALMVIRKKGTGDLASLWPVGSDLPPAVVTYIVAGGAIVLVATVAPEIVTQMLMVMVLLAFLVDVPYLTPTFDWVNAKVKTLAPA